MQLIARLCLWLLCACSLWSGVARAQAVEVSTSHTLFHESPTRTNMTVYTPGVGLKAKPSRWLEVRGAYEADVVSGASVATKAGSAYQAVNPGADVISTASVRDLRHKAGGGLTVSNGDNKLSAGYTYSTENDYRAHTLVFGAHTEAYQRNTAFDVQFAKGFDSVCNRMQASSATSTRALALENSDGCFADNAAAALRTDQAIGSDAFSASWTQAWTKIFLTQLVYSAHLLAGFQSNPYRSVILGQGIKAQEHHPEHRARHSVTARGNLFIKPLKASLKLSARGYTDSWGIWGGNVEGELEKYLTSALRVSGRGRFYKQSGASFWSDDYTGGEPPLGPKGQYFTGDRELSPFTSALLGLRLRLAIPNGGKRIAKVFHDLELGGSLDAMQFFYHEYTLGGVPLGNARAYIANLNLLATF